MAPPRRRFSFSGLSLERPFCPRLLFVAPLLGALATVFLALPSRAEHRSPAEVREAQQRTLTIAERTLENAGASIAGVQRGLVVSSQELWIASDVFADGAQPVGVELPERLGGGYLFHQRYERVGGSSTRLYRARTFTGPLEPWVTLPVAVERAVVGWDRIFFLARGRAFSLYPGADRALPIAPFPRVPSVMDLRFWGTESAAVRAPLMGWVVTHDGGRSFAPSELPTEAVFDGSDQEPPANHASLYPWLERAIRLGAPVSSDAPRFVFFSERERLELEVHDTQVTLRHAQRADGWGRCSAEGELTARWLCRSGLGADATLSLTGERHGVLVSKAHVRGDRSLLAVSDRAVLVDGKCHDRAGPGYCLLSDGGTRDIALPKVPPLAIGLKEVGVFALYRDEGTDAVNFLLLDLESGRSQSARVPDTKRLRGLAGGTILPRLHFTSDFGFWATRGEDFVGFTFSKSALRAGPLQSQLRRTAFAGARALTWGAVGFAKETTDGGMTWSDLLLAQGGGDLSQVTSDALPRVGASRVGAVLGDRLRIGWGAPALRIAPEEIVEVPLPPLTGSRLTFQCAMTSGQPLLPDDELATPEPLPPVDKAVLPLSVGGLRADVILSGVAGPRFGRESRIFIEYRDPFSDEVHRSKRTRGLFVSRTDAEQALGLTESSVSYATGTLSPLGKAGMLFVRTREQLRVFGFEQNGPIYEARLAESVPASGLVGVAKRHGVFYLAYSHGERLELFREEGGIFVPFAAFPLDHAAGRFVAFAEDEQENLAIAMDGDAGLFVFPLSDEGQLAWPPLFYESQSRVPPSCESPRGYAITRELPIAPQMESPSGLLPLLSIRWRVRAQEAGLCLEAMSARARAPVMPGASPEGTMGGRVPLTVFGAGGRSLGTLFCR